MYHTRDHHTHDDTASMLTFHTPETLGRRQSMTPEGFLLCQEVPIARIGTMLYGSGEVPVSAGPDGLIYIERTPEEVFREETIASFQGKPVTDNHPPVVVNASNWKQYAIGTVANVRRGTGTDDSYLFADLIIHDADAIKEIRDNRKREVSCGYDAEYEETAPGRGSQHNIIGNHVALVAQGRCGPTCSIGDESMSTAKPSLKKAIADRIRAAFTLKDQKALDEALSDVDIEEGGGKLVDTGASSTGGGITINVDSGRRTRDADEEDENKKDDEGKTSDALGKVMSALDGIGKRLDRLEARDEKKPDDEDETTTTDGDDEDEDAMTSDALAPQFRQVMSAAEILAPGIKLPTFDAKRAKKATVDAICGVQRSALDTAFKDEAKKAVMLPFIDGKKLDTKSMSCDAVAVLFRASAGAVKALNTRSTVNDAVRTAAPVMDRQGERSRVEDMAKAHNDFWNRNK